MKVDWSERLENGETLEQFAHNLYKTGAPRRTIAREINEIIEKSNLNSEPCLTSHHISNVQQRYDWPIIARESTRLDYIERQSSKDIYADFVNIKSKNIIVAHDPHIPYHYPEIIEKMLLLAERFNIKDLAIVGDFIDNKSLARFKKSDTGEKLSYELSAATNILELLFETFDKIYYSMGNHEARFFHLFEGNVKVNQLKNLIYTAISGKKLIITKYHYLTLNNKWRLTHPKNYSRIPPQIERRLAEKYHMHIIGAHGHLFGMSTDISGDYLTLQIGGLSDPDRTWYIKEKDTTHPKWTPGFWMIRNDVIYPFTLHENLTDWDFWLNEKETQTN